MKHINIIYCIVVMALIFGGCKSNKSVGATDDSPYKRKPMVEVSESSLSIESMMVDAKLQQEINNSQEALARYRQLLEKSPGYAPAHYEISQIMAGSNRLDSAIYHCNKAIDGDQTNKWYQLLLAELYGKRGDHAKQALVWDNLIKQNPDVIDYYYELSNTYISSNNIPKAVEALNRVEKIIGVTEPISLQKQKLWNAIGKYDKGTKEIESLSKAYPNEVSYWSMLAQGYMTLKEYEKAKVYFDKIIEVNPNDGYTHLSLAQYYQHAGDGENAYQSLKKGLTHSDLTTQSKLSILTNFYPSEEFYGSKSSYAYELMDLVMKESEDTLSFALFYGDVLMRQGKYAEAAHQFENYLMVDSSKYDLWEVILICESEIPDNEARMLDYAKRANKLFPLHSLPYYLQGFMASQHGEYDKAVVLLEKCVELGFNNGYLEAECYGILAESYYLLGKEEMAFSYYDKYLTLHPNDYNTLNNYAYFLAQAGQKLTQAETMAKTACIAEPTNATYLDTYAWVLYKAGKIAEAEEVMEKAMQHANEQDYPPERLETFREHMKIIHEK